MKKSYRTTNPSPQSPVPSPSLKVYILIVFLFSFAVSVQAEAVRYALIPENPRPGEPVTIGVADTSGAISAVLMRDERRLAKTVFFAVPAEGETQSFLAAVLTVPSTVRPGAAMIRLEGAKGVVCEIPFAIAEREFESEIIALNTALTRLRTTPDPQRTAESERLWAILNKTGTESHHFGNFSPPVGSTRRTSIYGNRRVYQYASGTSDTTIHAGVDYGIPTGTAVFACGPGRVVLAQNRIITGKSVIIEHLPGIYSLYYHLDTIDVSEGTLVDVGTRLGLSGATGLATGPHLHWEIRVFGENTDPDAFLERPLIDKDAILSKIYH
ncbi:MAG: M23 family metallopeptidase [Treponema sp.]|nr:M23 family metallopeptidase [Treponema sp.]